MISLQKVSKHYDSLAAVQDLTLEVERGEICVLLGKSGCGKSTTLRMINRLIEPTSGTVAVNGRDVKSYPLEELRLGIGYVVQSVGLFPYMTVEQNISVVPKLLKWPKARMRARAEELLALVGLDVAGYLHKYPSELSGGEAQRVGVARALAADPPIIIMDEPFGAVDPINRTRLQTEFMRIQKQLQKTVVFVTHDIEEALRVADKIAILEKGVLQNYAAPEAIIDGENKEFIRAFLGADYHLKLLSRFPVSSCVTQADDGPFEGLILSGDDTLQKALSLMISHGKRRAAVQNSSGERIGRITYDSVMQVLHRGGGQ